MGQFHHSNNKYDIGADIANKVDDIGIDSLFQAHFQSHKHNSQVLQQSGHNNNSSQSCNKCQLLLPSILISDQLGQHLSDELEFIGSYILNVFGQW